MGDNQLTIEQAAIKANCGTRTITRAIAAGDLAASKENRRTFIDPATLDAWIAARNTPAGSNISQNLAHVTSVVTQITDALSLKEAQ